MNTKEILRLKELINSAQKLGIVMHINPDGDALGSALAFYEYARNQHIDAVVISPSPVNEDFKFLPNSETIFEFEADSEETKRELESLDTVLYVDHSSNGRCGDIPSYLSVSKERSAYVDHHPSPDFEVGIAISVPESAATCCIAYELLVQMEAQISTKIADCLYTGIVTDTGNFSYGNNIAQVFRIASALMQIGANKEKVTEAIYHTNTENRLRLQGFMLKEKMQRVGKNAAYITLTAEEIEHYGAKLSDTEGFVNQPLSIKDVFISAIFIEKENYIKLSFRSRGEFDVNLLARTHFNGGGHKNAAGGKFYGTIEEAVALYSNNII